MARNKTKVQRQCQTSHLLFHCFHEIVVVRLKSSGFEEQFITYLFNIRPTFPECFPGCVAGTIPRRSESGRGSVTSLWETALCWQPRTRLRTGDTGGTVSVRDLEITAIILSDNLVYLFPNNIRQRLLPEMQRKSLCSSTICV